MGEEKEVVRFGPLASAIANGVRKGNVITLSGQVSLDAKGKVVGEGDYPTQIRQSYANISLVLEKFGAAMDDIIDETWFVTDVGAVMADIENLFAIRAEAYGGEPQVSQTLIQIAALVMPELLIEIKVIAVV